MTLRLATLTSLGGCGGSSSAPSEPEEILLLSAILQDASGGVLPGITSAQAGFGAETVPGSNSYSEVFEDVILTPAEQGTTFTSREADDVEFPSLVDLLTNGRDDRIRFQADYFPMGGLADYRQESEYTYEVDRGGAPDLAGFTITRFELHVLNFRIEEPGSDPNGDGDWQDRTLEVRLEIYGLR